LITNTFQAAILCLFNEGEEFTCSQIKQKTQLTPELFAMAMRKLCEPKIKVLCKEVNKPVFGDNEKITVNAKFA